MEVSTPPPASSAGRVEAKRSRALVVARYSGLMPNRSRARSDAPAVALMHDEGEHAAEAVDAVARPRRARP